MSDVTTNGNGADGGDAGLKIREKGVGHLDATLRRIEVSNNLIGGVSVREDADGELRSRIERVVAEANSGRGIDFDENGAGDPRGASLRVDIPDQRRRGSAR